MLGGLIAQDPRMVHMMQQKLNKLIGQSSGYIENLPAKVKRRVNGLKGIQKEHAKLEAKFQEDVLELEKKYFKLYTPLYERRAAIVNGELEPTEDEVTEGLKKDKDDEEEEPEESEEPLVKDPEEKVAAPKGVPEFWLSTLKQNPSLQELIVDEDEPVLHNLVDIRMEYLDKPGFKLLFVFSENPYFEDKILSKTYFYREENGYGGDFIYDHAEGSKIQWKEGKDLTVRIESKKQRNKSLLPPFTPNAKTNMIQTRSKPVLSKRRCPPTAFSTSSLRPSHQHQARKARPMRSSRNALSLIISSAKTSRRE
jgi:nucleosome assembly protein 1-like 1